MVDRSLGTPTVQSMHEASGIGGPCVVIKSVSSLIL